MQNSHSYRLTSQLLALPRWAKRAILILADYAMSILCLFIALALRYGTVEHHISPVRLSIYALAPILGLYLIGFYKSVTRIFFDAEMRAVLQLFLAIIVVVAFTLYFDWLGNIPRSVPGFYLFLLFIWLWNSRLSIRELLARWQGNRRLQGSSANSRDNCSDKVLIYGAGAAGRELCEALSQTSRYQVIAFVDDDSRLVGAHLLGKKIYSAKALPKLVARADIAQVFLAIPSISRARRRQIIEQLSGISVQIKQLPSLTELADGKVTVSTMHPVDILDVLDRQTVDPVPELLQLNITGKNVLVTGAGGSIGSELCRQIIKNKPRRLVLFELSEYALYAIHQELLSVLADEQDRQKGAGSSTSPASTAASIDSAQPIEIVALLGNVTNENKLKKVFQQYQVQTVYHAAAYKHVPIVEFNPFEGVINNAKGTYHCARAAIAAEVETFVLISTDKAVRPTNIMGASKRLAELACQALSQELCHPHAPCCTRISMVRFGNVLGSSGSVVPLFTRQIESGGPITVTHPEVTRYFMTIPEAANLVIQAGAMAKGGEVFVLDMGKPVKIIDLARRMVHLSGCDIKDESNPDGDIEIMVTGLRPGEKLFEELIIGEDNIESTQHPLIMQAMEHSYPLVDIEASLAALAAKAQADDVAWLKDQFRQFVAGYRPEGEDISKQISIDIDKTPETL